MLYTAIENYRQKLNSAYLISDWMYWIQDIRLAKMSLIKEVE